MKIMDPINIFYCYARTDKALLDELQKQLAPLRRLGQITEWHDQQIEAGKEWEHEIERQLGTADMILLLMSPAFLASDYCYTKEMHYAIEAHKAGLARVIPIIVRLCDWKNTPLGPLQALPKDGKPVCGWHNREKPWQQVVEGIKIAIQALLDSPNRPKRTLTYLQKTHFDAYDNSYLFEFLKWKYEEKMAILQRCGKTYPVAVYPASDAQIRDPESVLLSLEEAIPLEEDQELAATEYRELRKQAGGRIEDLETFTMKEFITEGQLGFKCIGKIY